MCLTYSCSGAFSNKFALLFERGFENTEVFSIRTIDIEVSRLAIGFQKVCISDSRSAKTPPSILRRV